jgi:DNA modification methylase
MIELVQADSLQIPLADNSVHCVVTSPPYWGLRDYGIANQLGLEKMPEEYVAKMVEVFREVKRVLHPSGTVWLNLGDSYAGSGGVGNQRDDANKGNLPHFKNPNSFEITKSKRMVRGNGRWGDGNLPACGDLKPKDLVGIPWRVAFALQADGWWLRSDIIWSKPNPMPESVTDRPTKAHEYVFLLSKSKSYFYDQEAIREKGVCDDPIEIQSGLERGRIFEYDSKERMLRPPRKNDNQNTGGNGSKIKDHIGNSLTRPDRTRNRRTVWEIATQTYSGAHFATYPEALVEPCIKAGSSEHGCCPVCGASWERVVDKEFTATSEGRINITGQEFMNGWEGIPRGNNNITTTGWRPTCSCDAGEPVPCTVLDPFVGSGTTLVVARRLGRNGVGLDLSFSYLHDQARRRLGLDKLKKWIENTCS